MRSGGGYFYCRKKKNSDERSSSFKLCFGNIDGDILVKIRQLASIGYLAIEISDRSLNVRRKNDIAESAGENAKKGPSNKAEGKAEEAPSVTVHHLL